MLAAIFILFVLAIFSGMPIVFAIGTVSAAFLYIMDVPMNTIAIRMMAGLDSFPLMAIPFFVLAGQLMDRGGIARRIIDWASALVGWITGSLLLMTVLAGAGFAAITGSGSASMTLISLPLCLQPGVFWDRSFLRAFSWWFWRPARLSQSL